MACRGFEGGGHADYSLQCGLFLVKINNNDLRYHENANLVDAQIMQKKRNSKTNNIISKIMSIKKILN